jgi:hypothetical protein
VDAKEIERIKRRLEKEAIEDHRKRTAQSKLAAYATKSNAKMRKSRASKASKRDLFTKGTRIAGSAFSRKG